MDDGTNPTAVAHLGEISHQAVTDVHRGLYTTLNQHLACLDPGNGAVVGLEQMVTLRSVLFGTLQEKLKSARSTAQGAGDGDHVARFSFLTS
jgi:hypothetical protein